MVELGKIAELTNGELNGDPNLEITGFAGVQEAQEGEITFVENRRYLKYVETTRASALIVSPGTPCPEGKAVIFHRNPSKAFGLVLEKFFPETPIPRTGIHANAEIEEGAVIGTAFIDAYVVVKAGARIGDGTALHPFVYIGEEVSIGRNCTIYPNATILDRCIIGDNVIIHSGTVIGGDGFGYVTEGGRHRKIPQRGIVEIEDDVEIGSNVTIDRARVDRTIVKRGTKIDNLVMIAHNVKIGEDSLIIAQSGVSGSTELGNGVTVAGQAGFAGHIVIGDKCIIGARSGVIKDLPSGSTVSGFPAMDHRKHLNLQAHCRKLPEVFERLDKLEKLLGDMGET